MSQAALFGPLCAFLSSLTWAIGTTTYSSLSRRFPPFMINFHRAMVAFPLFIIVLVVGTWLAGDLSAAWTGLTSLEGWRVGWFAFSVLCSYAFADVLFLWSTRSLGTPGALAIASTYPLWAAVVGWLVHGQALTFAKGAGLITTVAGTILVIISNRAQAHESNRTQAHESNRALNHSKSTAGRAHIIGIVLAIITSFFWAMNAFSVSYASQGVPVAVAGTARMFFALCLSPLIGVALRAIYGLTQKEAAAKNTEASTQLTLFLPAAEARRALWVFALEGFGGAYLYIFGMAHSSLAVAAVLTSLAPVLSIPLAWKFGGERISIRKAIGVTMVVVGVWLLL